MAADAVTDAWMEKCLITVSKQGDSKDYHAAGMTETVDFDFGDKDIEGVALTNGGRVTKWNPEGDSTITFEAYPLQAGTTSDAVDNEDLTGWDDLMYSEDSLNTVASAKNNRVKNDHNRDLYRVLFLWTNDTSATSAAAETAADKSAYRLGAANGYFTSVKPSFTDGVLKFTITFKVVPFDKSGDGNLLKESAAGSIAADALPAIANYTTSNKFG